MPFIIKRTDQGGGYHCDPSRHRGASYTRDIMRAKRYPTKESAERDSCPGNEVVIQFNDPYAYGA